MAENVIAVTTEELFVIILRYTKTTVDNLWEAWEILISIGEQ